MKQASPLFVCLGLLAGACSAGSDGGNTEGERSPIAGSGGSSGIAGGGGSSAPGDLIDDEGGTGENGDTGVAVVGAEGGGGQTGTDPVADGGVVGETYDAAGQDAGPPPLFDPIWQLQLPSGSGTSPTSIPPNKVASYSDIYFYRASDGGQIFMDPATGVTTSGSQHPRTELRESNAAGSAANWSPSGTNTMTVRGKVQKGSGVTIAQVFNASNSATLAELQYSNGGFNLFYEEAKGAGGSTGLGTKTALNTEYTFVLGFSANVLTVVMNGKEIYKHSPSASMLADKFYFKVGNYDQTSSGGAVGTTAHSIVENYSIVVVHQ